VKVKGSNLSPQTHLSFTQPFRRQYQQQQQKKIRLPNIPQPLAAIVLDPLTFQPPRLSLHHFSSQHKPPSPFAWNTPVAFKPLLARPTPHNLSSAEAYSL
jgi:hypothetical protein